MGVAELRSILLVTIHYHIRRAIIAARRHFPCSIEIGWVCYPSMHYSSSDWRHSRLGRENVASELSQDRKILRHLDAATARKAPHDARHRARRERRGARHTPPYATPMLGAAARFPEGRFIHAKANAPHRTSTYQETLEKATDLAAGLRERGMRAGDGLIINLRNSEDFIPTIWASIVGGFVAVPLVHASSGGSGRRGRDGVLAFVRGALRQGSLTSPTTRVYPRALLRRPFHSSSSPARRAAYRIFRMTSKPEANGFASPS